MSDLTPMRLIWLGLSLIGALVSLIWWAPPRGGDWVAIAALMAWCMVETGLRRNWLALATLPALAVGPGLALPLYLFFRSRRIG